MRNVKKGKKESTTIKQYCDFEGTRMGNLGWKKNCISFHAGRKGSQNCKGTTHIWAFADLPIQQVGLLFLNCCN